jgi:hypothetical protein
VFPHSSTQRLWKSSSPAAMQACLVSNGCCACGFWYCGGGLCGLEGRSATHGTIHKSMCMLLRALSAVPLQVGWLAGRLTSKSCLPAPSCP